MTASNVYLAVADPDALIAGTQPGVYFAASHVQLYRFATEALARAATGVNPSGGTLVTTFTLIASTEAVTAEAGPFRFATYDSGQDQDSWYAYRYRNSGSSSYTAFSLPWQAANRLGWTLAEVIYEAMETMGPDMVRRGTATAGAASTVTCTDLFRSSLRSSDWYEGSYIWLESTTDDAAPLAEERLVASVNTSTGVATVDNDFSDAVGAGDVFQLHSLAAPSEIIRRINQVRERMFVLSSFDIAIDQTSAAGNRYPVPQGVRTKADIIDVAQKHRFKSSQWQALSDHQYIVEFDGLQGWLILLTQPETNLIQVRYEQSFRSLEGLMTVPTDVTRAPIEWLRRAVAWEVYRWMDEGDGAMSQFAKMTGMAEADVGKLSGRYAPSYIRRLHTGAREQIGPIRRGI